MNYLGSDDEEPFYDSDYADYDDVIGYRHLGHQNERRRNERDSYFLKILLSVTGEENKSITPEDEERLFDKISLYLKKPFTLIGILTLQKLAFIPPTVSADRLKEIAKIICKNIFNPLSVTDDYISEYADFCKGFAYLKATTNEGVRITFEQILISALLEELPKTFCFSQRLIRLLENRDIPQEKKQKWLENQIEEQRRVFKIITNKSIRFLDKMFQLYPEIVYRVIEFLLKSGDEDGFQYLCDLLGSVRYHVGFADVYDLTNIYSMKLIHWERNQHNPFRRAADRPLPIQRETLTPLFARIITLSNLNNRLTADMRDDIQYKIIDGNPVRENSPQDYMKYCIKDCLHFEQFKSEDDFKIDDEGEYDCHIYTLRSKDFTYHTSKYFWRGLRVKILTRKKERPPAQGQRFGFGPVKQRFSFRPA